MPAIPSAVFTISSPLLPLSITPTRPVAMHLSQAYTYEIQALDEEVSRLRPPDILQFCADYFAARLASERAQSLASYRDCSSKPRLSRAMSGQFTSPFGANANPFGGDRSQSGTSNAMHRLVEEDENDPIASPTAATFATGAASALFGGDATGDTPPTVRGPPNPDSYPAQYNFGRRTSVSAESLKPSADTYDNWTPPLHQKSADQLERLKKAIAGNFLFSHLDDEQSDRILGALVEKPIPAKGIKV